MTGLAQCTKAVRTRGRNGNTGKPSTRKSNGFGALVVENKTFKGGQVK